MNILKILPLSKQRLEVLFEIYAEGEDYLRNISKRLKMNPSLAFNILKKLYQAQFVDRRKVGKEIQYSLQRNRDYNLVVQLLEKFYLEKAMERSNQIKTAISLLICNKEVMSKCTKIYLFGSFVAGGDNTKSDIDLLFITEEKALVSKACREISLIVGKEINPLIYSNEKFRHELKNKEALLSSIINNIRNRAIIKKMDSMPKP